ncbi:MAG: hypothetical protein HQL69_10550 [Magnetococcales bacterium]|nr:hypothetical protein [Magnetococcales bacterium]
MTYFSSRDNLDKQLLVVLTILPFVVLIPGKAMTESSSPSLQQGGWVLAHNSQQKGIIDLEEYTYDADSYYQYRGDSTLNNDQQETTIQSDNVNNNVFQQLVDDQPQLEKWVDPWFGVGDNVQKEVVVNWNPDHPFDMSIKARPFHSIEMLPAELKKIEINKGLAGDTDDLSACYSITDSTSAEIVQQGSEALFVVSYSGKF